MKPLKLVFLPALVLSVMYPAQCKDYLITRQNDTIYGTVREYGILSAKGDLAVGKGKNKKHFNYNQVKEWKHRGKIHMLYFYTNKKGREWYIHLSADIKGKMRLLSDPMAEEFKCWVYIEGRFFRLPDHNLAEEIWPLMLACEDFAKMYGNVPPGEVNTWNQLLRVKYLEMAIRYYNAKCGK